MADFPAPKIRNLTLVGHASAGKTMLAEAMMVCAGEVGRMGSIEAGTTQVVFTDVDGRYTLQVPPGRHELRVALEGYQGKTIAVDTANRMQLDAEGTYYDPGTYALTGALYEPVMGLGFGDAAASYRRKYLGFQHDNVGAADKFKNALSEVRERPVVLILRMRKVLTLDATGLHAQEDIPGVAAAAGEKQRSRWIVGGDEGPVLHFGNAARLDPHPAGEEGAEFFRIEYGAGDGPAIMQAVLNTRAEAKASAGEAEGRGDGQQHGVGEEGRRLRQFV